MYMLNVLFDLTDTDGRFMEYNDTKNNPNVLGHSKAWLQLVNSAGQPMQPTDVNGNIIAPNTGGAPSNPFAPAWTPDALPACPGGQQWQEVGQDGSLLLSKSSNPGYICVRYAYNPSSTTPIGSSPSLRMTVTFGREPKANQVFSSPFTLGWGGTTSVCTVFSSVSPDFQGPNSSSAWFFALGPLVNAPAPGPTAHHYEFQVATTYANAGQVSATYGHDPEMDVSS
jgi:hypothetical protein